MIRDTPVRPASRGCPSTECRCQAWPFSNRVNQTVRCRPHGELILAKFVDRVAAAHLPRRTGVVEAIVDADVVTDREEQGVVRTPR